MKKSLLFLCLLFSIAAFAQDTKLQGKWRVDGSSIYLQIKEAKFSITSGGNQITGSCTILKNQLHSDGFYFDVIHFVTTKGDKKSYSIFSVDDYGMIWFNNAANGSWFPDSYMGNVFFFKEGAPPPPPIKPCSCCKGTGKGGSCWDCGGDGRIEETGYTCLICKGTGTRVCSCCYGSGKQ